MSDRYRKPDILGGKIISRFSQRFFLFRFIAIFPYKIQMSMRFQILPLDGIVWLVLWAGPGSSQSKQVESYQSYTSYTCASMRFQAYTSRTAPKKINNSCRINNSTIIHQNSPKQIKNFY